MKPGDHIKRLRYFNELSRKFSAMYFHSPQFCHYKHKDAEASQVCSGVFRKQKKICRKVINNIQITLLIPVFLKSKYIPASEFTINVFASLQPHMLKLVVVVLCVYA